MSWGTSDRDASTAAIEHGSSYGSRPTALARPDATSSSASSLAPKSTSWGSAHRSRRRPATSPVLFGRFRGRHSAPCAHRSWLGGSLASERMGRDSLSRAEAAVEHEPAVYPLDRGCGVAAAVRQWGWRCGVRRLPAGAAAPPVPPGSRSRRRTHRILSPVARRESGRHEWRGKEGRAAAGQRGSRPPPSSSAGRGCAVRCPRRRAARRADHRPPTRRRCTGRGGAVRAGLRPRPDRGAGEDRDLRPAGTHPDGASGHSMGRRSRSCSVPSGAPCEAGRPTVPDGSGSSAARRR